MFLKMCGFECANPKQRLDRSCMLFNKFDRSNFGSKNEWYQCVAWNLAAWDAAACSEIASRKELHYAAPSYSKLMMSFMIASNLMMSTTSRSHADCHTRDSEYHSVERSIEQPSDPWICDYAYEMLFSSAMVQERDPLGSSSKAAPPLALIGSCQLTTDGATRDSQ